MSVYRCGDCGHGKHLEAWGSATVHGPLDPDGSISEFDWDDVYDVHEDSIQCGKHPGGRIEKKTGRLWCYWRSCPWCYGNGRVRAGGGRSCPEELAFLPFDAGERDEPAHGGWWPVTRPVPPSPPEQRGHVIVVEDKRYLACERCGLDLTCIAAADPCRGVHYRSPAWERTVRAKEKIGS